MDREYFRYICRSHKKTFEDVAKLLGINTSTFYRKLSGDSDFTRNEIQMIKSDFGLSSDAIDQIFFAS